MQLSRRAIYLTSGLIVCAVLFFVGVQLYEKGWRFGLPTVIVAPGIIEIQHVEPGQSVHIDGSEGVLAGIPSNATTVRVPMSAGTHELSIEREGYYPWQKSVDVDAGETVVIAPFQVPSSTHGVVLPKSDQEYPASLKALASTTPPTKEKPLYSNDGTMSAYLSGNNIMVAVAKDQTPPQYFCDSECHDEHQVISVEGEVRSLAFFPGRNDVLIVAAGDSVFAIESDTRGTQNFEPIYQGIRPSFGIGPGYLYVQDGPSMFIVSLMPVK